MYRETLRLSVILFPKQVHKASSYSLKSQVFTPSNGEDKSQTSLLLERVGQQPVEVVAFAEHPRVVREPEVHREYEQEPAVEGVLKTV